MFEIKNCFFLPLHWLSLVSSFSDLLPRWTFNGLLCDLFEQDLFHMRDAPVDGQSDTRVPSAWFALIHCFLDRQLVTQVILSLVKTFTSCFWFTHRLSQNQSIDPAATIHHPSAQSCSFECSNHSLNNFHFIKKTPVSNLGTSVKV